MGLPDEREVRKAAGRAREVKVYPYGGRSAALWWNQNAAALERLDNVSVIELPASITDALAALAERSMRIQCTIQDSQMWLAAAGETHHFEPVALKRQRDR